MTTVKIVPVFGVLLIAFFVYFMFAKKVNTPDEQRVAYEKALKVYNQKKAEGLNFENGPCLTNDLMPDWVADIAHSPRIDADNNPDNQCLAYREGKAVHFIELTPDGKFITAR